MKENKVKEALGKIGKATIPAMMLMGMAWNANATAMSATELGIRAKEAEQKTQPIINVAENYESILAADGNFNFSGECWGCDTSCGGCSGGCTGCTGCTGTCSGGCSGGCTGTSTAGK